MRIANNKTLTGVPLLCCVATPVEPIVGGPTSGGPAEAVSPLTPSAPAEAPAGIVLPEVPSVGPSPEVMPAAPVPAFAEAAPITPAAEPVPAEAALAPVEAPSPELLPVQPVRVAGGPIVSPLPPEALAPVTPETPIPATETPTPRGTRSTLDVRISVKHIFTHMSTFVSSV